MTRSQILVHSQLIVSNMQMTMLLCTVCIFGIIFGFIQAANDPESKGVAIVSITRNIMIEVNYSCPLGALIGMIFGIIVEYLR